MQHIIAKDYTANRAWEALDIAQIDGATIRLHWTDQPYIWHINDGPEVFIVLDGEVDIHTRLNGVETVLHLSTGDIFHAQDGDEHFAEPIGIARVLVIERAGSI